MNSTPAPIAPAGQTCDYLAVHNTPCGEPATHSYVTPKRLRFYLCAEHCNQVYRDTKKRINPTPLVSTILNEKKDTHIARAVTDAITAAAATARPVYIPEIPAIKPGKSLSQLYAEMQQSQSEGSDLL